MKKEDLIGKKVKGFKFENTRYILYLPEIMDKRVGKHGVIKRYLECSRSAEVEFSDNVLFLYPIELVYDHLVDEDYEKERKEILDAVNGGDYRTFDTGSVRDSNEGKPRVADMEAYVSDFSRIASGVAKLLEYKNEKYGNSALNPVNIFNGKSKVGQRADDKISRIQNSDALKKNDIVDLIGYLILMCKENEWTEFDEFMD